MKNSRRTLKIMGGAVIAAAVAVTAGLWYCKEKEIEPSAILELISLTCYLLNPLQFLPLVA